MGAEFSNETKIWLRRNFSDDGVKSINFSFIFPIQVLACFVFINENYILISVAILTLINILFLLVMLKVENSFSVISMFYRTKLGQKLFK